MITPKRLLERHVDNKFNLFRSRLDKALDEMTRFEIKNFDEGKKVLNEEYYGDFVNVIIQGEGVLDKETKRKLKEHCILHEWRTAWFFQSKEENRPSLIEVRLYF